MFPNEMDMTDTSLRTQTFGESEVAEAGRHIPDQRLTIV